MTTAREIWVTVSLPPIQCSPNRSKRDWHGKRRAKSAHEDEAHVCAAAEMKRERIAGFSRASIELHFYCGGMGTKVDGRYRPRDPDNAIASCKGCIDGLVKAGLIPGDGKKAVASVTAVIHTTKKQHGGRARLVVKVREVLD